MKTLWKSGIIGALLMVAGTILLWKIRSFKVIPPLVNVVIIAGIVLLMGAGLLLFVKTVRSNLKTGWKVFLALLCAAFIIASVFFSFVAVIFGWMSYQKFDYEGKTYYCVDYSWLDPSYEIMEKTGAFRAKKVGYYEDHIDISKDFTEAQKERLLKHGDVSEGPKRPPENDREAEERIRINAQKFLDSSGAEMNVAIPGTDLGLAQMQKAGARVQWFFVKKEGQQLKYLSEVPLTGPEIFGKVDDKNVITLIDKDINGNEESCKSEDGGLTWEKNVI